MDGTFWIAMGLVGLPVGMFLWAGTFDWLEVHRMRKGHARPNPAPTLEDTTERLRALHRKYRAEAFKEWDAEFARLSPPAPYTFEPERFPGGATIHAVDDGENYEIRDFTGRVISRRASPRPPKGGGGVTSSVAAAAVSEHQKALDALEAKLKSNRELKKREQIIRFIAENGSSRESVAWATRLLHQIEEHDE